MKLLNLKIVKKVFNSPKALILTTLKKYPIMMIIRYQSIRMGNNTKKPRKKINRNHQKTPSVN